MQGDTIEHLFAQLTAIFEDAAALAAEGQRRAVDLKTTAELIEGLRTAQLEARRLTEEIGGHLQ